MHWITRVREDASPWKHSNKERIGAIICDLDYFNTKLYSMLPDRLRNTILELGVARSLVNTLGDAQDIFNTTQWSGSEAPSFTQRIAAFQVVRAQLKNEYVGQSHVSLQNVVRSMNLPEHRFNEGFASLFDTYSPTRAFRIEDYETVDGRSQGLRHR